MKNFKFQLEKYKGSKSRHICPVCGQKEFSLYVDENNNCIDPSVGKCNRLNNCGYHLTPSEFYKTKGLPISSLTSLNPLNSEANYQTVKPSYHPISDVIQSLKINETYSQKGVNNFLEFIENTYDLQTMRNVRKQYFIGTSDKFGGKSTIFWQIDNLEQVRAGKIIKYNPLTGKRVKIKKEDNTVNLISWYHKGIEDFNLKQCLFGLHQLRNAPLQKQIAVVESEKTAIICSIEMPEYIWLSCGSLQNLSIDILKPLFGRCVTFFPDCNGFDYWNNKISQIEKKVGFSKCKVSDLLEKCASDEQKQKGYDLADFLLEQRGIKH